MSELCVGVLALQGAFREHVAAVSRLGVAAREVRQLKDMDGIDAMIIPGGESTCLARLLVIFGLDAAIRSAYRRGVKIWGTCAGAILLASRVMGGMAHLGLIDMEIERNGFGSQLDSFTGRAVIPKVSKVPVPLIFIRAPKIRSVGPGVEILWQAEDYIAAVETREGLATVFHPELTNNLAFHSYFARKCGLGIDTRPASPSEEDSSWTITSWTRHMRIAPG